MKKIAVLGSTGSIGVQALDVIRRHGGEFSLVAVCAHSNIELLKRQIEEFKPKYVGVTGTKTEGLELCGAELFSGKDAAAEIAALDEADVIVNGISGIGGLKPLLCALENGKTVALANKESIVCGHGLVDRALKEKGAVLPVDSEISAIFQCIGGADRSGVKGIILTASGGPFFGRSARELKEVTPEMALRHPTWSMGKKITVDSASMFNKGLEIMEAGFMFGIPPEDIGVLVHRQSVVHSLVEFKDGSVMAQMSVPDMRLAIQYALTYPNRIYSGVERLDLSRAGSLEFHKADDEVFRAIPLAYEAMREGETLPVAYNGANDIAVELFLKGEIRFNEIWECVEYAMGNIKRTKITGYDDIIDKDAEARELAIKKKEKLKWK